MTERIIIAGAGGQGIMIMGKVLAEAAMQENKFVTWLPAYGAEVRGGTAHCMEIISDREIASPYIDQADDLIIMNYPSWMKFRHRVKTKGLILVNSSLVTKDSDAKISNILRYPFTELAIKLGNIKVANMIALGSYLARNKIVQRDTVLKVVAGIVPKEKKDLIEINQKAFYCGLELS